MSVTHHLYTHTGGEPSREVLRYVEAHRAGLQALRITVAHHPVDDAALADPRVVKGLKSRGLGRLPALRTPNRLYVGAAEITAAYGRALAARRPQAAAARPLAPPPAPPRSRLPSFEQGEQDPEPDFASAMKRLSERRSARMPPGTPQVQQGSPGVLQGSPTPPRAPPPPQAPASPPEGGDLPADDDARDSAILRALFEREGGGYGAPPDFAGEDADLLAAHWDNANPSV